MRGVQLFGLLVGAAGLAACSLSDLNDLSGGTIDGGSTPTGGGSGGVEGGTGGVRGGASGVEGGASCTDGKQNGGETDVDCGGECPPCALGARCARAPCTIPGA